MAALRAKTCPDCNSRKRMYAQETSNAGTLPVLVYIYCARCMRFGIACATYSAAIRAWNSDDIQEDMI